MSDTYQVGQVLFAIDNNRFGIIPVQIIEHHVRTSLNGTDNNYFVIVGGTQKKIDLSSLAGPIFDTSKDAGDFLMSRASEKIQSLMTQADNIANEQFEKSEEKQDSQPVSSKKETDETVYVDLPDGTRAKLSGGVGLEDFNS
tara:strand:- start:34 stop:459 length:426 start_codon:yes stop_codon:yes gene_type:complete